MESLGWFSHEQPNVIQVGGEFGGEVFATTISSKNLEFETSLVLSLSKEFLELVKCIRLVLHRVDDKVATEVVYEGNKVFETFTSHSLDFTDIREDST